MGTVNCEKIHLEHSDNFVGTCHISGHFDVDYDLYLLGSIVGNWQRIGWATVILCNNQIDHRMTGGRNGSVW